MRWYARLDSEGVIPPPELCLYANHPLHAERPINPGFL
jgi:hypothetical protein